MSKFKTVTTLAAAAIALSAAAQTKAVTSTEQLAGGYVTTFETLVTTSYDGGFSVDIEAVEGTDSIQMLNFWSTGLTAKAHVDISSGKITIPCQILGTVSGYGEYQLSGGTSEGTLDSSIEIEGTILSDGSLSITTPWGVSIPTGAYAGYTFGVYHNALIEPANATMTYVARTATTTTTTSFNVIVTQTSDRKIAVKNFADYGHTVAISLRTDSVAIIHSQLASTNYYGDWYTYSAVFSSNYSGLESYDTKITCDTASDARTVSWGEWTLKCSNYYTGCLSEGKIETNFDLTYPSTSLALDGDGSQASPYLISSQDHWETLADYLADYADPMTGQCVRLEADIDFDGSAPAQLGGDLHTYFNGTLDGNNKTLSGINFTPTDQCQGSLFTSTGTEAALNNFTVEGTVSADTTYIGGIVGKLQGSMTGVTGKLTITAAQGYAAGLVGYAASGARLTGCTHQGSISSADEYFAGIAAYCENGVTFDSCANLGTLTYTGDATTISGAAGIAAYSRPSTFTNCFNSGTIQTANDQAGGLAGILAMAYTESGDTARFTITGCSNSSDLTGAFNLAGIVLTGSNYTMMDMADCHNSGNMTSTFSTTSTSTRTAGVAAFYFYNSTYYNCSNSGDISSTATDYVGGVFGTVKKAATSTDYTTTITACHNSGAINGGGKYTGGVVGYLQNYTTVDSCYNLANVTAGGSYTGGVIGGMTGKASMVTACWNIGNVTTAYNRAGGVIGYNTTNATVANCFSIGDVASTSTTSGINSTSSYAVGGVMGLSASNMTNVYAVGSVTALSRAGGIVGQPYASLTSLDGAYFAGTINATAGASGNIIGVDIVGNASLWTSANSIARTYYLAQNAVECADTTSQALSQAELAALEIDGWINGDDYTYPILADNDYAKAYAAIVVPAQGDSLSSITGSFHVGTPDGLTWTAYPDIIDFDGNLATFTQTYQGELTLTASCGDAAVTTLLTCDVYVDGVGSLQADSPQTVSRTFYTTSGIQVPEPRGDGRSIYILVETYDDGSRSASKVIR